MRNRMMRLVVFAPVVLMALVSVLVGGCSETPVASADSSTGGQSQEISIIEISSEGDVDVLHPRLVTGVSSRPITSITFELPVASQFAVLMYDVSGDVVFAVAGQGDAGTIQVTLDFSDKPSGIYVVTVFTRQFGSSTKFRMVK